MVVVWRKALRGGPRSIAGFNPDIDLLLAVRGAGIGWSLLFVAIGFGYELQLYADGSIFSYAVAVEETWAFHWRNIPNRLFVHLLTHVPAEAYIRVAGDAAGGVAIYGFLFFAAPLLGLVATCAADRSRSRVIFTVACVSTACLCPLVFGFPTEMWIAHSVFWPALAVSHFARRDVLGTASIFLVLLALAFTHEGGLVLAAGILASLVLRGVGSLAFLRAMAAFLAVLGIWVAVRMLLPPDPYYAGIIVAAAFYFIDVTALAENPILLIFAAVGAYLVAVAALRQIAPGHCQLVSVLIVAAGLAAYWLWFDSSIHAENRYAFRTALLAATPVLGMLAAVLAQSARGSIEACPPSIERVQALLGPHIASRTAVGALTVVALVHAVETAKFVSSWADYKTAVRSLATTGLSDPVLGDSGFVSADRISGSLRPLSWFSTTPYLSVLVAPRFQPDRLVVDPNGGYYWLSCDTAAASHESTRSVPTESRRLLRVYACLHRPRIRQADRRP